MVRHTGEDFVDVEGVTVASVLSLQSAVINGTKFYAPKTNCLATYRDPPFSQEVYNIALSQVEAIVEPDSVGNDIGRESVALVGIHLPIRANSAT